MIFSDSPKQRALERMMTTVSRFKPRGSATIVLHGFMYTAEMCDCRVCLHYDRKRKYTAGHCPLIEERIMTGAANRGEVMAETMENIFFCVRVECSATIHTRDTIFAFIGWRHSCFTTNVI